MSVAAGPTVNTNGLVFYYDNGNAEKSFIGPPTTNLVTTQVYTQSWNNSGTATWSNNDTSVPRLFSNIPVSSMTKDTFGNSHIGIGEATISTNTTYAVSIYCYIPENSILLDGTAPYMRAFPTNASRGYLTYNGTELWNTWPRNTWIRANGTFASGTDTSVYVSCYLNSATNKVAFTAAQVEAQTFTTRFVNGTRSNTQSLIDLTGNNTITATSLTYSSTGTFSFNGSNRANLTMTGSSSLSQYTRIVWVRPTASSGDMKSAMLNQIGNNSDMAVGIEAGYPAFHQYTKTGTGGTIDGDWTLRGATLISLNNVYMIAATVDRSTSTNNISVYLNGVLDGVGSRTIGVSASDNVIFGGPATDDYAGSRMWYGDIYAAYQYNRVLSAAEIAQNFNATRSRFGL